MAALAPIATIASLAAAGVSAASAVRQAQAQRSNQQAQLAAQQQQEQTRQAELITAREQDRAQRQQTLARTIAATRARLGAAGIAPDEGSAGAVTAGLSETAAAAEDADDTAFRLRLARGRPSLLAPDGSLNAVVQVGRSLGYAARSLLG